VVLARTLLVFVTGSLSACTLLTDLGGLHSGQPDPAAAQADAATDAPTTTDLSLSDQSEASFAGGQYLDTRWEVDHVALVPKKPRGDYLSRVFDLGGSRKLARLEWKPGAPYGKPLPDGARAETGYRRGGVDMRDAAALLHLDGNVTDMSGRAVPIVTRGAAGETMQFASALFGQGFSDTKTSWAYGALDATSPLATGTSDFTWSLWVQSTQGCADNIVYLGGEDANDGRPHLWMGCAATFSECPAQDGTGRFAGYFGTTANDEMGFCGARRIDDGKWHHLAVVKAGHSPASMRTFVDGTVETAISQTFQAAFVYDAASQLALGSFVRGEARFQSSGLFDELAILRRAMSDAEIGDVHARGALRLTFQIRTCTTSTCSDDPAFVGPGSDGKRSFTDVDLAPPARADLSAATAQRWFQYRAHFESDIDGRSPELYSTGLVLAP